MSDNQDVLVMGAGLAGCCAAIAAREGGVRVTVVEKASTPGGSSIRAAGTFAFAGTDMQHAIGVEDSSSVLADEMKRVQGHGGQPRLVDVYVRDQVAVYEWLKSLGIMFERVQLSGGQSCPRAHAVDTGRMIRTLWDRLCSDSGVTQLVDTQVERIERTSTGWTVQIRRDGVSESLQVRQVILASGGFSVPHQG